MPEITLPISIIEGTTIALKLENKMMIYITTGPIASEQEKSVMMSLKEIIKTIAETLNIDIKHLYANKRKHEVVYARFCYYYIAKYVYQYPLKTIGDEFKKHHTTVMYGINEFEEKRSQQYKLLINYIYLLKNKFPEL
ncbi:MAG: hypothetical protein IPG85_09935 [Bacteroidetes bacterium]|nr:hypothetical protein [Bacteroidota bacterium]